MKIPYQIRIEPEQLEEVRGYGKEETENNVNAGFRRLVKLGLIYDKLLKKGL